MEYSQSYRIAYWLANGQFWLGLRFSRSPEAPNDLLGRYVLPWSRVYRGPQFNRAQSTTEGRGSAAAAPQQTIPWQAAPLWSTRRHSTSHPHPPPPEAVGSGHLEPVTSISPRINSWISASWLPLGRACLRSKMAHIFSWHCSTAHSAHGRRETVIA